MRAQPLKYPSRTQTFEAQERLPVKLETPLSQPPKRDINEESDNVTVTLHEPD